MKKPYWTGKLRHSRNDNDDWGMIRDECNMPVIRVPILISDKEAEKHRREGTDPTQPMVDYLLSVLNGNQSQPARRPSIDPSMRPVKF